MNRRFVAAAWAVALLAVPARAECEKKKMVTEIGKRFTDGHSYDPMTPVGEPPAKYTRVNMRVANAATGRWSLIVRDSRFHLIQTFTNDDFKDINNRWTARVPGAEVWFELDRSPEAATVGVIYDYFIAMPEAGEHPYYSIQGAKPAYVPLYLMTAIPAVTRRLGDYVGFLMTSNGGNGKPAWTCSGVMVTPMHFLTNWHCGAPPESEEKDFWTSTVLRESIIDLSWDDDQLSREYAVEEMVSSDPDLDYALLRVAPLTGDRIPNGAVISRAALKENDGLQLIHHPLADRKQISSCNVFRASAASWRKHVAGIDFTHKCDTEAGSSGGAVFNGAGQLVGLHHRGFDYTDDCQPDNENKAVHIGAILDHIHAKDPAIAPLLRMAP
jgi:hypothetical protein